MNFLNKISEKLYLLKKLSKLGDEKIPKLILNLNNTCIWKIYFI
jgi:hypothetical protein